MILYKYTSLKYIKSCFEYGVFASTLNNVNDPYEVYGIDYPDEYRICCMTKKAYMPLMWAYYGNHQGCCIGFEIPNDSGFRAIQYLKKFENHDKMNNSEIIDSLYHKGYEWKHEKEYRAVYYSEKHDNRWCIVGKNVFFRAKVKSVILGYRSQLANEYRETLEYLKEQDVEISKCKLKNNRYEFYSNRQFDINLELKSLPIPEFI